MRFPLPVAALALTFASTVLAQPYATKPLPQDKFRQLEELLPTPNLTMSHNFCAGHRRSHEANLAAW